MPEPLLTVDEVATWLRVNPQTVRNWLDRGELQGVRLGSRRVRIRQSDLDRFIVDSSTIQHPNARDEPAEPEHHRADARKRLNAAVADTLNIGTAEQPTHLAAALRDLAAAANDLADSLETHKA